MRLRKDSLWEVLISLGYSLGGSLGLNCIVQWMAMSLDGHLVFPYRQPFTLIVGALSLFWCLGLLVYDVLRKSDWKWWQKLLCRAVTVVITFLPLVMLWAWLIKLGDRLMGTDAF